jgi:iron complex outermembrane receptor protein
VLIGSISLLALGATASAIATAAQSSGVEATEGSGLQEIVVTARRREENLQIQPLSITALTSQELADMNIRSFADIRNIPNVSVATTPGFLNSMAVAIRGITQTDPILSDDQPIATYIDGVLIARMVGNQLDLIDPERIEVLRGPQGSLFGRNTTGGAVNITRPAPADKFAATARIGYASNNELTVRSIVDTGDIGDTGIKAKFAVQSHTMDGWIRNTLTSDARYWGNSDDTTSAFAAVTAPIGTVGSFDYRFDYSTMTQFLAGYQVTYPSPQSIAYYGLSPTYGGDPFIYSTSYLKSYPIYPLYRSRGQVVGNVVTLNFPVSDALNIKSISAIRSLNTNLIPHGVAEGHLLGLVTNFVTASVQTVTPYETILGPGQSLPDPQTQHQFSQELQVSGQIDRHKYVGGLYYFREKYAENYYASITLTSEAIPPLPPNIAFNSIIGGNYYGTSSSYAIYLSDSYTPPILNDKFEITGGVRYTIDRKELDWPITPISNPITAYYHYKKFSAVSGDATFKYQWTPDLMSYLRYANAYKSGGFSARDVPSATYFNPETANNYEGGFKMDALDNRLRVNGDVFYTRYTDKQVNTFVVTAGQVISGIANAGTVQYLGTELEITAAPLPQWEISLSAGQTWPKYLTFYYQPVANGPVYNIASSAEFPIFQKTSAAFATQYTLATPVGELTPRLDVSYKSGMYFLASNLLNPRNGLVAAHAATVLNANIKLAHIPVNSSRLDVEFSAYCTNCFDKEYIIYGTDYGVLGVGTNVFSRPRVWGFNVEAKY